jgi:Ca2+-binding EF-hand superfamily protein
VTNSHCTILLVPMVTQSSYLTTSQSKVKGEESFKAGRYDEAIELLTEALRRDEIYSILLTRAQAHIRLGQYKEALRDAQGLTAIKPTIPKGYLLQAQLLQILHRYTSQVEAYDEGLRVCDQRDSQYILLERGLHDAKQISKSLLNDPRMIELFVLFDKDRDSMVDFREVALGLYQLTDDMDVAQRQASALLLMMDPDDKRVLTFDKFAKLIMAMAGTSATSFDVLYKKLKTALTDDTTPAPSQQVLDVLQVSQTELENARDKIKQEREAQKTLDALSYSRTSKLFDLWDLDKSGTIDFQELLTGLRKYQRASTSSVYTSNASTPNNVNLLATDVERDALGLMGHDQDSNQELDKEEFALAMSNYADAIHIDLHELIDFMCVVSSQSETTEYETMYSDATPLSLSSSLQSTPSMRGGNKFQQNLGTILDMGDDDEEEEDDE